MGVMTVPLYGAKAAGRVAWVDAGRDYELVMAYRWNLWEHLRATGSLDGPYAVTTVRLPDGRRVTLRMHRLLMPGVPKIDHRDNNGLNCQRYNLREATDAQNAANRGKQAGSYSSQFKGVSRSNGKWTAMVRKRYLGQFADEVEAARAYDAAARIEFGEFARLNFPELGT